MADRHRIEHGETAEKGTDGGIGMMNHVRHYFNNYFGGWLTAWDRFWFTPRSATSLAIIRLITGCCAIYNLLVWTIELPTFFGSEGVLPSQYRQLYFGQVAWSHFDWIDSPTWMWVSHFIAIGIAVLFTLGIGTRMASLLTAAIMISYANRATGALFGFDQILVMLCLYTAIGHSGGGYSVDRWLQCRSQRQGRGGGPFWSGWDQLNVSTNIAIRLIQLHLCLIYFYAGLGKLQGETWWTGQAIWFSVASYEYQTMDLTWLSDHMNWVAFLTLITVYWEVTYPALIWSRLTRPIMLGIAVLTHLGIGLAMGMMTFGIIMLVANFSFVELGQQLYTKKEED